MLERSLKDKWLWLGPWLIIALGLLIALAGVFHFYRELTSLTVVGPPLAVLVINGGFAIGLVYAGWRLRGKNFQPMEQWRITAWSYGGATILVLVATATIVIRVVEGRIVEEAVIVVLINAGTGGLAGYLIGLHTTRADREKRDAQEARETLAFVNRMLRHELLNGTNVILAKAIQLSETENTAHDEDFEVIVRRSRDLVNLVETIRPVAQAFTANGSLHPVSVSSILDRSVNTTKETYPNAEISGDIPDELFVRANDGLVHVFANLFGNAIEHNDTSHPQVDLLIDASDQWVEVAIADNGPGIPDEQKTEIFEPNHQLVHGFGLYLVHTLVTRYGGEVKVEDRTPRGSVFTVTLPRVVQPRTTSEPSANER